MRNKFTLLLLATLTLSFAQNGAPASPYYDDISNWSSLSPSALKSTLETKIATTHTNYLTYSEVWNATQATDLDPNNSNNVLLLYGWENGSDSDLTNVFQEIRMLFVVEQMHVIHYGIENMFMHKHLLHLH